MKDSGQKSQHEDVFSFVFRGSSKRLDGETGDWHAHMNELFLVGIGLNVVGVVKQHPALAKKIDVVVVAVLVQGDEEIRLVPCREDLARPDAHLKDGWPSRNGRGDGHIGHHILRTAARKPRQQSAGRLNSVLGISSEANDGVANAFGSQIRAHSTGIGRRRILQSRKGTHDKRLINYRLMGVLSTRVVDARAREATPARDAQAWS